MRNLTLLDFCAFCHFLVVICCVEGTVALTWTLEVVDSVAVLRYNVQENYKSATMTNRH
jgi:hypothetical protein